MIAVEENGWVEIKFNDRDGNPVVRKVDGFHLLNELSQSHYDAAGEEIKDVLKVYERQLAACDRFGLTGISQAGVYELTNRLMHWRDGIKKKLPWRPPAVTPDSSGSPSGGSGPSSPRPA
jgi:hypothetical protein